MNLDASIKDFPTDLIFILLQRNNLKIEGKGTIFIKNDNAISIKVFIKSSENFEPASYFTELLSASQKAGKIISDDVYFSFRGQSLANELYSCDKAILVDSITSEIINVELKDYLSISNDFEYKDFEMGKIVIPYEIPIPMNRAIEINKKYSDNWVTQSVGLQLFETDIDTININIFNDQNKTIIFFQSNSKHFFDLNDIYPIVDSLGFLTSTIIDIYDTELASHGGRVSKKIICPSLFERGMVRVNHPPLGYNLPESRNKDYCNLFNNFYIFRTKKQSSELEYVRRQVIGSANSYFPIYALTLSTSIELIAKTYFSSYAKEISAEDVTDAKLSIEDITINKQLKDRILGLLKSLVGQIRAKDILVELYKNGIIQKEEYIAWTKLRNLTAHGDKMTKPLQEYYNLSSLNLILFYKLIFAIINYNGLFTNYSEYGYPIQDLNKNAS